MLDVACGSIVTIRRHIVWCMVSVPCMFCIVAGLLGLMWYSVVFVCVCVIEGKGMVWVGCVMCACVFVCVSSQDHFGRAEGYHIVHADHQFIVPTDGKPIRGLIQDHVVSGT